MNQTVLKRITSNRKRLLGFGVLSLILGIVGIFMSSTMTITSIFIFGIFMLSIGLIFLVEAFSAPKWKGKLFNLLISLLYVFTGIIMMIEPTAAAVWFTFIIAAVLIGIGSIRIIIGFQVKGELVGWGWISSLGLLNIILGVMIYAQWPESGLWVIGLFISIDLIMQGINSIILAQEIKEVQ